MIGTGRKPFLSSSHSDASNAPSSGSVNTLRSSASASAQSIIPMTASSLAAAATAPTSAAAGTAAALESAAASSEVLRALRADVARLRLAVERLHVLARWARVPGGTRFGRRSLLGLLHVGPAASLLVLLPVAAVVALVHVAVATRVDVVAARALGEGGVADLRGLHVAPAGTGDAAA